MLLPKIIKIKFPKTKRLYRQTQKQRQGELFHDFQSSLQPIYPSNMIMIIIIFSGNVILADIAGGIQINENILRDMKKNCPIAKITLPRKVSVLQWLRKVHHVPSLHLREQFDIN